MATSKRRGWPGERRRHSEVARKGRDRRVRAKVMRGPNGNGAEVWVRTPIDKVTSKELDRKLKANNLQSVTIDLDLDR